MSKSKIVTFIESLNKRTTEGRLKWEQTVTSKQFQTSFSTYSVILSDDSIQAMFSNNVAQVISGNKVSRFNIKILNDQGEVIEAIGDIELEELMESPEETMENMYNNVRRQAMGVDAALDSIIGELDDTGF